MRYVLVLAWNVFAAPSSWEAFLMEGNTLRESARFAEAEKAYGQAWILAERFEGADVRRGQTLNNLGALHFAMGRYADADAFYGRALPALEAAGDQRELALAWSNLAALRKAQARYDEAEHLYQRALLALPPEDAGGTLNNLAELYCAQHRYPEAEKNARQAVSLLESSHAPGKLADAVATLGNVYRYEGRHSDAKRAYQRSLEIRRSAFGPSHPAVAVILNNLAVLSIEQRRIAEAESFATSALAIAQAAPAAAATMNNLAQIRRMQGAFADADRLYRSAIETWERALGPEHPAVATGLMNFAAFQYERGRYSAAAKLYARALSILEKNGDASRISGARNQMLAARRAQKAFERHALLPSR